MENGELKRALPHTDLCLFFEPLLTFCSFYTDSSYLIAMINDHLAQTDCGIAFAHSEQGFIGLINFDEASSSPGGVSCR